MATELFLSIHRELVTAVGDRGDVVVDLESGLLIATPAHGGGSFVTTLHGDHVLIRTGLGGRIGVPIDGDGDVSVVKEAFRAIVTGKLVEYVASIGGHHIPVGYDLPLEHGALATPPESGGAPLRIRLGAWD